MSGNRVVVRWDRSPEVPTHVATVRVGDGRSYGVTARDGATRLVLRHVGRSQSVRVRVAGMRSDSVMGAAATARLKAKRYRLASRARFVPDFVFFRSGRSALGPRQKAWLRSVRGQVMSVRAIRCEGHSSPHDGVSRRWLELVARLRARRACDYLRTLGFTVPMTVRGYGAGHPRLSNRTLKARQLNMRVEIVVVR